MGEFGRRMNGEKKLSVSTAFLHMAIHVICLLSLSPQSLSDLCAPVNFGSGTEAAQNSLFPSLRFWGQRCAHRKQICSAFFYVESCGGFGENGFHGFPYLNAWSPVSGTVREGLGWGRSLLGQGNDAESSL